MNVKERLAEIEREGYLAALRGDSLTSHAYRNRNERDAFSRGYYRGVIEVNREREAKKEQKSG